MFLLSFHEDNSLGSDLSWSVPPWIQEQKLVLKLL